MRLDWDCVRAIMLATEGLQGGSDMLAPGMLPGFDEEIVAEHIRLLHEARLVDGYPPHSPEFVCRLTWSGHQMAATLRDRGFLRRILREARQREIALTFDAIGAIAKTLTLRILGD